VARHFLVSVTAPTPEEAERLGHDTVSARLAACAQVDGPITSTYWWDGELTTETEWRCVLKTTERRMPALVEALRAAHSYDVPEVVATPIEGGSTEYLDWLDAETATSGRRPAAHSEGSATAGAD